MGKVETEAETLDIGNFSMKSVTNYTPHRLSARGENSQSFSIGQKTVAVGVVHFARLGIYPKLHQEKNMTRRMWVLFSALVVAAMPLMWFSADPNAGDVLLQLTQPNSIRNQGARPLPGGKLPAAVVEERASA